MTSPGSGQSRSIAYAPHKRRPCQKKVQQVGQNTRNPPGSPGRYLSSFSWSIDESCTSWRSVKCAALNRTGAIWIRKTARTWRPAMKTFQSVSRAWFSWNGWLSAIGGVEIGFSISEPSTKNFLKSILFLHFHLLDRVRSGMGKNASNNNDWKWCRQFSLVFHSMRT